MTTDENIKKKWYEDYNKYPDRVMVFKQSLEPIIAILMDRGLPHAYLKALEPNGDTYWYHTCESGSEASEGVPEYMREWADILNELISENIDRFKDEDYLTTQQDRDVARQIAEGKSYQDTR